MPPRTVLRLFLPEAPPGGLRRLKALLPAATRTPLALEIPLDDHLPEEVLALCLSCGITARATRILELSLSG